MENIVTVMGVAQVAVNPAQIALEHAVKIKHALASARLFQTALAKVKAVITQIG